MLVAIPASRPLETENCHGTVLSLSVPERYWMRVGELVGSAGCVVNDCEGTAHTLPAKLVAMAA